MFPTIPQPAYAAPAPNFYAAPTLSPSPSLSTFVQPPTLAQSASTSSLPRYNAVIDTRTVTPGVEDIRTVSPYGVSDTLLPVNIVKDTLTPATISPMVSAVPAPVSYAAPV